MGHLLGASSSKSSTPARGGPEREAQGENQPTGAPTKDPGQRVSGQPSLSPRHDRLDGGSRCRLARRREAWFRDYYGAANATLVLAGDITPADDGEGVKYFGDIPAGAPVPRQQPWIAPRKHQPAVPSRSMLPRYASIANGTRRNSMTRICRNLRSPPWSWRWQGLAPVSAARLSGQTGRQRDGGSPAVRAGQSVRVDW